MSTNTLTPSFTIHPLHNLTVVLVSPRNTLNIGAVARAMSNFGAHDLRVANIFYKEFRSASSAVGPAAALMQSARDFPSTAEAVHDAQLVVGTTGATLSTGAPGVSAGRPFLQPIVRLESAATRIRAALDRNQRVALLFGSEKFGLSNDDMSHCHMLLRIPTRDEHPSMNLGQAAAVCLYELARMDAGAPAQSPPERTQRPLPQDFPRAAEPPSPAPAEVIERLTALLDQTLTESGFPGMGSPTRTRQLRALLRRLQFSRRDAELSTGFLRQILWKLGASTKPEP